MMRYFTFYFFVFFVCIFSNINANAQTWFDLTVRAGWGTNLLINKNVFNDKDYVYRFSHGFDVGGKFGLNIGDENSVSIDVMSSKFSQDFLYKSTNTTKTFSYQSLDIGLLYRNLDLGRYVEIGPVYSMIDETYVKKQHFGVLFGLGRALVGNDRFSLNAGVRFKYLFQDILNDEGKSIDTPAYVPYQTYEPYTPLSMRVVMEVDWAIGMIGKSTCYKGRRFIMF